jgi:hypothetical protein
MPLPHVISMEDRDLRKHLLETCPVRPGQESRAWAALREELYAKPARPGWSWIYLPVWRSALLGGVAAAIVVMIGLAFAGPAHIFATADSQAPGVYATSFYSQSAKAQVVWLNGMEPATDKPTFLDATGAVADDPDSPRAPASDPNSL